LRLDDSWYVLHWRPEGGGDGFLLPNQNNKIKHEKKRQDDIAKRQRQKEREKDKDKRDKRDEKNKKDEKPEKDKKNEKDKKHKSKVVK